MKRRLNAVQLGTPEGDAFLAEAAGINTTFRLTADNKSIVLKQLVIDRYNNAPRVGIMHTDIEEALNAIPEDEVTQIINDYLNTELLQNQPTEEVLPVPLKPEEVSGELVSEEIRQYRNDVCMECEMYVKEGALCGKCNCSVEHKIKWVNAVCPWGEW